MLNGLNECIRKWDCSQAIQQFVDIMVITDTAER